MKKIFVILAAITGMFVISNTASAQTKTKISDGVYLVNYGNAAWGIENDNTQQCIEVSVKQVKKSDGSVVYDILCGNKYTKGVSKVAIGGAIGAALTSLGQSWLTPFAVVIASNIYDDTCDYYKEKK